MYVFVGLTSDILVILVKNTTSHRARAAPLRQQVPVTPTSTSSYVWILSGSRTRVKTSGRQEVTTPQSVYISSDTCYYSGMQEGEKCYITDDEASMKAMERERGRGSMVG